VVLAARLYAMRHGLSETPLRFDVVTIDGDRARRPAVHHCRGAFDATGR
jgi:Holliday junction resolvase-like predicted endonuclease